jgi:serine kinase of HPr protein (carbohydrate metabolism regulator)
MGWWPMTVDIIIASIDPSKTAARLLKPTQVRGVGLLDIKAIFGETAVRRKRMRLALIVHLGAPKP